jgi:SAM-dependent methyltransferase
MTTTDRVRRSVVRQFHNPAGPGGHFVGWVMGHRGSNVARSRWAVGLLAVAPDARVLELGCGPGVALAALAERAVDGLVVGVDHSAVMIRQARRRNAAAVAAGRVHLVCSPVEDVLPAARPGRGLAGPPAGPFGTPFDAVLAVNSVGFWPEPEVRLASVRHLLRRDGQIALVAQPRCPGATAATSHSAARELAGFLGRVGFIGIGTTMLDLDPPVACVRATNPDDAPIAPSAG